MDFLKLIKSLPEKNVFYSKADKSRPNTVVIVDKNEYYQRAQNMLDECPYEKITKNPFNSYCMSFQYQIR